MITSAPLSIAYGRFGVGVGATVVGAVTLGDGVGAPPPPRVGVPLGDAVALADAEALGDTDGDGHGSPFERIFDQGNRP